MNNFAFEVKVIVGLESTILDDLLVCRPDGEAGNETSYSPVGGEAELATSVNTQW